MRYGGTIVSVHGLCRALARRGHDVHVYTTSVNGPGDSPVPHGEAVDVDGVKVWYFQSQTARRVYYAPPLSAMLRAHVGDFAVVHTHAIYLWPLWAAARRAYDAGVPYVVSPRGMLEKELLERKSLLWKAALIGFIEKQTLERAAAIHVTSRREAAAAAAFGFALPPMYEIPNGVDFDRAGGVVSEAIEAANAAGPYALFLGRINWKKGLDRLIRALAHAPGVRLVLAGNDEEGYRAALDRLAAEVGVAERITYTGSVDGADKARLLKSARLLVLPSYSENFGNVVLEAMAAATPVIVTPEVGVADLVRESGTGLVVDGEPFQLGDALQRLWDDGERRAAMGGRGPAWALEHCSWDAVAARMEQLYTRVTAGRPAC